MPADGAIGGRRGLAVADRKRLDGCCLHRGNRLRDGGKL